MGKIGIITLNGYFNYGNRLQNFALQQVLKSFGYEVETIIINNIHNLNSQKNFIEKIIGKNVEELLMIAQKKD